MDGPVASGKSTVGRRLAARLGWRFIDTGLMYRAVAYIAVARRLSLDGSGPVLHALKGVDLTVDGSSVKIDDQEIGSLLQTPVVAQAASRIAQLKDVRAELVARQRQLAADGRVVMVGRDIGTVVLPHAPLKVYLEAPAGERARRRHQELEAQGVRQSLAEVLSDLKERDRRDQERAASPLRPALDARILQTEGLTVDGVVDAILVLAKGR